MSAVGVPVSTRCSAGFAASESVLSAVSGKRSLSVAVNCRSELGSVAEVQEEIKVIVAMAESVSLTATNALLVAKRAGKSSVGFSVVARELRRFAENLGSAMSALSLRIYGLVGAVASKMQRVRQMGKLCAACTGGAQGQRWIAEACGRSRGDLEAHVERLGVLERAVSAALAQAEKQCVMGMAVGRAARIEAAYGGAHEAVLRQISAEVEESISGILSRIRRLKAMLA